MKTEIIVSTVFTLCITAMIGMVWYTTPTVQKDHTTGKCVRVYSIDTSHSCQKMPRKYTTELVAPVPEHGLKRELGLKGAKDD